jgi:hypothetical protein
MPIVYLPLTSHKITDKRTSPSKRPPGQMNDPPLLEYPTTTQEEESSNKLSANAKGAILDISSPCYSGMIN